MPAPASPTPPTTLTPHPTLSGVLGSRLKVRVAAPASEGQANTAVVELIARTIGCRRANVTIDVGQTQGEKTLLLDGVTMECAKTRLGL
ncbi:MAG: DUF167 domain-containing protein [Phycisphaerales bacterium]|jgi:uncharacterized protein YggU (UPF0235/DUF167 family)